MDTRFPAHWECVAIGDVTKVVGGGTPPSKDAANFTIDGGVSWLTPADLSGYRLQYISRGARNLSQLGFAACSASKIPAGSVLFSSRAPIGYVAIASNELATNQGFKSFVLPEGLNSRFVYYYLRHIRPLAEAEATGTTFKELSGAAAAKLPLLIAPVSEQKRIADKLDTVLARVDACSKRLETAASVITRFRQSVLSAATSGRLTEDWRASVESSGSAGLWRTRFDVLEARLSNGYKGKRREEVLRLFSLIQESAELPIGWVGCPVGVVGLVSNGSTPSRADKSLWGPGVSWVSSGEVRNDPINETREQITDAGFESCSVKLLPVNTVLIAMIGEGKTRGQSAILKIPATINQNIAAVVPFGELLHSEYLWYSFQAAYEANRREGNGTGPQALNCQRVRELRLNLPPLDEQHEITRRVDKLFALADRLEERLDRAESAVDRLSPALLAKAFRGELVAQDPADESASELLRRLQENAASGECKISRKGSQ